MKNNRVGFFALSMVWALAALTLSMRGASPSEPASRRIPEPLKAWETWATWGEQHRDCPTPYSDPKKHLCFWPSRLNLEAGNAGGRFAMAATVFHEAWLPLPGGLEAWPMEVRANGGLVAVLERDGRPEVRLAAGAWRIEGSYRWSNCPQRIALPREIGILALSIDGNPVDAPVWDSQGFLWLKRDGSTEEADKDFLSVKLHALLEDGIPLWLRTEIEMIVSGKSREEDLGTILPAGWRLATVESPIPVAVDDAGRMKVQVRAGKWTLRADAFRFDNPKDFRFAPGAKPAVEEELVAFRASPDFRVVEIVGAPAIDVSQTTFPEKWRDLPVYRWETKAAFQFEERMRGMGQQKPEGLRIARELWLDENGGGLTFRDRISGTMQQVWRLDAAPGQDLGSVRSGGQGQLITRNPRNGASGVEIRTRDLNLEATGRMTRASEFSATGWRSDADALSATLSLPPGWRLFALFGADWVEGDWLTTWTLLDLFILLVFSLAVFRLWGWKVALLAFLAFALSYHEPDAPRYLWLVLLVPLALQRVVPEGRGRRVLSAGKWTAVALLMLALVPFVVRQIEQALYPQLELVRDYGQGEGDIASAASKITGEPGFGEDMVQQMQTKDSVQADTADIALQARRGWEEKRRSELFAIASKSAASSANFNLSYDTKARIQTGPGVPEWSWRAVSFGWNGPVSASQQVKPVLISMALERALTVLRVVLLLALAATLLNVRRTGGRLLRFGGKTTVILALILVSAPKGSAQSPIPDKATLDQLRERLLEVSDAYPAAADIPSVSLTLADRKIVIEAEIHAAIRTAVPLPGRLPAWSPLSVLVDGQPEVALRRDDGFLWITLPEGVHRVRIEGILANLTEWEWQFPLKPRQVKIEAPGWAFSGVRPDGVPEQQVFFTLKQKTVASQAGYDRQELQTVAAIDRRLELGLLWQVRTTVSRLSPTGKAIALRVPLLPGENVLSPNAVVKDGVIEVRLGAQEQSVTWESDLAGANTLELATRGTDSWVERWRLVVSPVWNVAISGLAPTFEAGDDDLVPVWQPWPGEAAVLAISRPEAIAGATVTVNRGSHEINLGKRQRVSKLDLSLRCSVGEDFLVQLPAAAEVTALTQNDKPIPVRMDGDKLIVPLHPGEQSVSIGWKVNGVLGFSASGGEVRLPVESANIQTVINVPQDRWVLWAAGPQRGPAVRFWGILLCSLLAAGVLGRLPHSPIRAVAWMLLAIGLTQVPLPAALLVVSWLFLLAWRGSDGFQRLGRSSYNAMQAALVVLTIAAIGVLFAAVGEGLLGSPEMFIVGNGSYLTALRWFQARCESLLPCPSCYSVSIWWYRVLMLGWALWLAASLVRWLQWGWTSFGTGGLWRKKARNPAVPPPVPE
ncbi:MAG: hypothetical protein IPL39_01675 [Opitutaceae bacterium]|nr:hypothetical protein [Opitutaceae bacterium]